MRFTLTIKKQNISRNGKIIGRPVGSKIKKPVIKKEKKIFTPCSLKQQLVLQENSVDILLTGGGAGSGKSFLSLLKAADMTKDPAAKVMVLRLSYPMLKDLISASKQIYPHFGGVYKTQARTWIFPNGAEIDFKAMPKDLYEVQGWERTAYICDEAAEFQLEDILALMTRLRSTTYKGKMSILLTCNPSKSSYLLDFVQFSLDDEGVPKEGTEYKTRYFVVQDGKIRWADSDEELTAKYGVGLTRGVDFVPMKFKFIPMLCTDNQVLMKQDPAYVGRLLATSRVNMLRLLKGSWYAKAENAGYFRREMVRELDLPPENVISRARGYDLAATMPSESNPNPDWTASVLMSKTPNGYVVEHVERYRLLTHSVLERIVETARRDREIYGEDIPVYIPKDGGSGGAIAAAYFVKTLTEQGVTCKVEVVSGHQGKLARMQPFLALAEAGLVSVVKGDYLEDWYNELEDYEDGKRNQKDDMFDATATSCKAVMRTQVMPTFTIPSLTQPSPIATIG